MKSKQVREVRILLASNASYDPPRGGATRANLVWLKALAKTGHAVRVISAAWDQESDRVVDGVSIRSIKDLPVHLELLREEIEGFSPGFILVSSEDLSHRLLREAGSRLIYLAHTPQFFPFGPESWNPDSAATELVRNARAVVAIGRHMAAYIKQFTGRAAAVIHPPIYGEPPFPFFGSNPEGFVLTINPCAVKGIDLFLALAAQFPDQPFAGLAGWGTTARDRERMAALPNVRILESVPQIDDVLRQARLLLMPSLWYEGFGLIAMEAMLRGVPVISSDSGGLVEAKAGTGFILPVSPVTRYLPEFDEVHMPMPVVPVQDLQPWAAALQTLLSSPEASGRESDASRAAATQFVSQLDNAEFEKLLYSLDRPAKMRILLAHNSLYFPSQGGGDKSNRLLMEALAALGHTVHVVARMEAFDEESHSRLARDLDARGVPFHDRGPLIEFERNGVRVFTLTRSPYLRAFFSTQIAEFDPEIIITSTDDPAQLLFELAWRAPRARVVYLVRATIATPFGPDSSMPNRDRAAMLRYADGVVGVSEYVAQYARDWGKLNAVHVPISLMEAAAPVPLGSFHNSYITMVNPCAVKGISVFLALAEARPDLRFAAIPSWGTTPADFDALGKLPNVDLLPPVDDIASVLAKTRVMLVPSVWAEARSRMVMEAMMHGIPVMASEVGGLREAKLGTPYLLPVNPITNYRPELDRNMVPVAQVPPQDIAPWLDALDRLTGSEDHWNEISRQSYAAAARYLETLTAAPFERYLAALLHKPKQGPLPVAAPAPTSPAALSEDKQRLLALRLKQRVRSVWFPKCPSGEQRKLFCFPHAGAGPLVFRDWALPGVVICPALLPGREDRALEPPFQNMASLIEALVPAILPLLTGTFSFFGHSMGAGVAFELARALRRAGTPLPAVLAVSGARSPQYRLDEPSPPEPDEAELAALIHPAGIPLLRADIALYRRYRYVEEPPLPVPLYAYRGEDDPNISAAQLNEWNAQTSSTFAARSFPGGHLFWLENPGPLLAALARDLNRE